MTVQKTTLSTYYLYIGNRYLSSRQWYAIIEYQMSRQWSFIRENCGKLPRCHKKTEATEIWRLNESISNNGHCMPIGSNISISQLLLLLLLPNAYVVLGMYYYCLVFPSTIIETKNHCDGSVSFSPYNRVIQKIVNSSTLCIRSIICYSYVLMIS